MNQDAPTVKTTDGLHFLTLALPYTWASGALL